MDDINSRAYEEAANRKYAALKQAVEDAGFFAPHVIGEKDWDQLTCTSKYQQGYGYTGKILFVTEFAGRWYFSTPHPFHYRVLDGYSVADAVVHYLGAQPKSTDSSLTDSDHKTAGFVRISHDEYEIAADMRTDLLS